MTSHKKVAFLVLLSSFTFSAVVPMHAQQRRTTIPTMPRYTPPPAPRPTPRPAQTQSTPAPQRHVDPPVQHQSAPAAQRQTRSVPQRQTTPAPQHQTPVTPQRPAPSTSVPRTNRTPSTPQSSQGTSHRQHAQVQRQEQHPQQHPQKEEARQQKERMKQERKTQKEQARQQKDKMKQEQKTHKEQARQQKQRMKQEQKAQKEQARQEKGRNAKPANDAALHSTAPKPPAETARTPQAHTASASAYRIPGSNAISGKTSAGSMTLTREGSQSVVQQVNSARSRMGGINQKPLPSGDVTVHPNGRLTVNAPSGRHYGVRSDGTISSYRDSAKTVSFDRKGRVSSLRTSNLEVRRGTHGERTIISHNADNSKLVNTGRRSGYVERNVTIENRTYIQRTTVINQQIVTRNYAAFTYGGVAMGRFVTPVFYAPAFYGWAYYPWAAPVHFTFGWFGAPWYIGPDPYFAAYPVYPSASLWVTDYLLGETLATAYQLHADAEGLVDDDAEYSANASAPDGDDADQFDTLNAEATTPITAEIKASIAEEVKQELSYDSAASAAQGLETGYDEVTSVLGRPNQVFVVSSGLDVTTVDERGCGLQPGDILQLESAPASDSALVRLRVASSKRMDCPAGVMVTVSVSDLQEMHNSFRAQVEAGLGALQAAQGHNGIPVAPPAAVAAPPRLTLAGAATVLSADITTMFDAQRQQAYLAEAHVTEEAFSQGQ
jgi:hypothetical protein